MFASQTTKVVTVPGSSHTVTIHKLSGKDLDAAQYAHMTGVAAGKGRNWATTFVQLASRGVATAADAQKVIQDPLAGFDRLALAKGGIGAWSCVDAQNKPLEVTPKAVEDLEDEPLEFLATEILRLTKPGLFLSPEEQEAARKNG